MDVLKNSKNGKNSKKWSIHFLEILNTTIFIHTLITNLIQTFILLNKLQ